MTGKRAMYSIGQMAELSNASTKQLRYLEAKGVFVPAVRGADNNYRYYAKDQLTRLAYIRTLRDLGFSLEDIVSILDANDKEFFAARLQKQVTEAQAAVQNALQAYERLTNYASQYFQAGLRTKDIALDALIKEAAEEHMFTIVDIPVQRVIFVREKAAATSVDLFIDRYFGLQQACLEKGLLPSDSMFAVFHDGYFKQFDEVSEDLETFFPVPVEVTLPGTRTFGGFQGVSAIHVGHYRLMKELYVRMAKWAKTQGLNLANVSVEKYILGPDMTTNPEEFVTQVIIPLAGSKV